MGLKRFQLVLIICISILVGYVIGMYRVNFEWKQYQPHIQLVNAEPPSDVTTVDMTQFWTVWEKVSQDYYDKKAIDPKKMMDGAIAGMVSAIGDPYTMYLPPTQNSDFQSQLAGQFTGIGAELGMQDRQIIVIAPIEGSPAQKAGIRAGDAIATVDGKRIDGWTLPQTVTAIRGPKGTTVTLEVLHKGDSQLTKIPIVRDVITVKSVDGWVKQVKDIDGLSSSNSALLAHSTDKVMYVRLSQFGDNTNKDWSALITQLASQAQGAKGMVLDLRNNPGGYLKDAAYIAGEFLPIGKVVVYEADDGKDPVALAVDRQGSLLNMPLVILINGGSASASEIVSGAMQDYKRATLVGDQSFGKGTIQNVDDLGGGAGLHVTIAKWLTPTQRWIHGKGLTPDVPTALNPNDPSHDTQLEAAIQQLLK